MKKSLVGVVLGLVTVGGADASIVSRGFFEEQIGNYATLDLLNSKANQMDLNRLTDMIGTPDNNMTIGACELSQDMMEGEISEEDLGKPFFGPNVWEFLNRSYTDSSFPGFYAFTTKVMYGWAQGKRQFEGVRSISNFLSDFINKFGLEAGGQNLYSILMQDGINKDGVMTYPLPYLSKQVDKIGTLPVGYETVGAALEAINAKVDNKITNLSATASNGKYVLTAVKEGDQTTYAWESIDRSESENTQSVE